MKRLSRLDLEKIGERVINAYRRLPEIKDKPLYRIDPEILVEKVLHLNLGFHHLSLDDSILGLTSFREIGVRIYDFADEECYYFLDGQTVLIERDLKNNIKKRGQCNFTTAHEAAHQILKMLYPKDCKTIAKRRPLQFYKINHRIIKSVPDWTEWQANALASALLLPPDLVDQAQFLFGLPERIKVLNKITNPKVYEQFKCMADFFGVSMTALAIRLTRLGRLEKNYLHNPYEYLKIEYTGG